MIMGVLDILAICCMVPLMMRHSVIVLSLHIQAQNNFNWETAVFGCDHLHAGAGFMTHSMADFVDCAIFNKVAFGENDQIRAVDLIFK